MTTGFENICVRKMQLDDTSSVVALEKASLGQEAWGENSFNDVFTKDYYYFYLAFINDIHVGTVGFTRSFDEADISNVCVNEKYRKNGVGYTLLNIAMEKMIAEGVLHFTLEVREKNIAARNLYSKLGFIEEGVRPNFYSNPTDNAVIMWKHLESR